MLPPTSGLVTVIVRIAVSTRPWISPPSTIPSAFLPPEKASGRSGKQKSDQDPPARTVQWIMMTVPETPAARRASAYRISQQARLQAGIEAAAIFLPRDRAEELLKNIASWDAEEFHRRAVLDAISHRVRHFGLVVSSPGALADAIVAVWEGGWA